MNISSTIKSIQDIMRKDDGVDGDAQRIGQLTWMLFLKVFDQREEEWEDDNPQYQSPIPERFRWRNWAAYKADNEGKKKPQIQGSELTPFINNELFPAFKEIDAVVGNETLYFNRCQISHKHHSRHILCTGKFLQIGRHYLIVGDHPVIGIAVDHNLHIERLLHLQK